MCITTPRLKITLHIKKARQQHISQRSQRKGYANIAFTAARHTTNNSCAPNYETFRSSATTTTTTAWLLRRGYCVGAKREKRWSSAHITHPIMARQTPPAKRRMVSSSANFCATQVQERVKPHRTKFSPIAIVIPSGLPRDEAGVSNRNLLVHHEEQTRFVHVRQEFRPAAYA